MGTRLYPTTTDHKAIENLIGVPAGTYKQFQILRDAQEQVCLHKPYSETEDIRYAFWNVMEHHKEIGKLQFFLSEGWGKFNSSLLPRHQQVIGRVFASDDFELFEKLLLSASNTFQIHHLDPLEIRELTEGVCWH